MAQIPQFVVAANTLLDHFSCSGNPSVEQTGRCVSICVDGFPVVMLWCRDDAQAEAVLVHATQKVMLS